MQYYDAFFGFFNAYVMSFMVLIIPEYLLLVILAHAFIILIVIGLIYIFKTKNPFYTYFSFGAIFCGSFYALPGILLIPLNGFIYGILDYIIVGVAICELLYIVIRIKDLTFFTFRSSSNIGTATSSTSYSGMVPYDSIYNYPVIDPKLQQNYQTLEAELKEKEEMKAYNKKTKRNWIISISCISILGYYISYFSNFI
ncbi:MAG: hypothetical protein ACFE8B_05720 [Candidatus Hermodarchaeota archaeon]